MHVDPYIVLGSAVIGFLVGMTGAGGGTEALGWILCAVLLAAATAWLLTAKPWLKPSPGIEPPAIEPRPAENPRETSIS